MSKSIKIAYLSVFPPYRGGIAQFNQLYVEALKKQGHEVAVFNFKTQYPDFLFPGKSQFTEEHPDLSTAKFSSINPLKIYQEAQAIKAYQPTIFITAYWMPFFAPSLGLLAKLLPKNCIKMALLHNVIPHEPKGYDILLNRFFLNQFDTFITLSPTVTRQLLSIKPKAKYLELFHPVYTQFGLPLDQAICVQKLGLPRNKKIILFFGFIRKYKGLDLLIEAFGAFKETAHLVIAGESYEDFSFYQKLLQTHKIAQENYSHFDGFISDELVQQIFSASDCIALPYKSATQSGISAIANSFNLPQIVTPVGELINEVKHLETGYLCDAVSVVALTKGIANLLNNSSKYKYNLQEVQSIKTWENFSEKSMEFTPT